MPADPACPGLSSDRFNRSHFDVILGGLAFKSSAEPPRRTTEEESVSVLDPEPLKQIAAELVDQIPQPSQGRFDSIGKTLTAVPLPPILLCPRSYGRHRVGVSRIKKPFLRTGDLVFTHIFPIRPQPQRGFTTKPGVAVPTAHPRKNHAKSSEPQRGSTSAIQFFPFSHRNCGTPLGFGAIRVS